MFFKGETCVARWSEGEDEHREPGRPLAHEGEGDNCRSAAAKRELCGAPEGRHLQGTGIQEDQGKLEPIDSSARSCGVMTRGQSRKMKKSPPEENATKPSSNAQAISGLSRGEGTQGSVPRIGTSQATLWEELE